MSDILSGLLGTVKKIKIGTIVSTTNKTLKTIKKAIPVYKEVRPYLRKEKTLFKKEELINNTKEEPIQKEKEYNDTLTFFH